MPTFHLGTMGFSWADWSGVFYPKDMKPGDYLAWYARHFDAVELDTTFHGTPPAERVRRWAESTPADFRFCAKAPKTVTHEGLTRAENPMREFLDVAREFGPKLGVVLLQFPPSLTVQALAPLAKLLTTLPSDVRFAAEFRHPSWDSPAEAERVFKVLAEHRCARVGADYAQDPWDLHATTDFLYLRWIGQHHTFARTDREQIDVTERLRWWATRIADAAKITPIKSVWGFFNNDYAGYSVGTCNRFKIIVGEPVRRPTPEDRGELFG